METKLQKYIDNNSGKKLSDRTLRVIDLIAEAYDLMENFKLNDKLRDKVKDLVKLSRGNYNEIYSLVEEVYHDRAYIVDEDNEEAILLWDEISMYFDSIAPEGYYFGSDEGSLSSIGWFKLNKEREWV